MREIAVTIGWKLIDDNNNVVGFKCDYTDNGRCYKDISAYDKQTITSPIYIPECEFDEEDIIYVNEVTQITLAGTYYAEWINFVRDVLNDVPEVENMSWKDREKIAQYLAKNSLEECDWQSLYTFLESWEWEDCIEDIIDFCIPPKTDYRAKHNEFRNGMIKAIINNADTINSKLTTRKLGYIMCGEPDENIDMGNGKIALRAFIDPIFIVRIEGNCIEGYPANKNNIFYADENYYAIEELTTETLIDLCEKM